MSRGSAAAEFPLLLMSLLAFPSGVPSSQARHSRRGNTPKEALIPLSEALLFSGALRLTRDGSSYGMSLHRCGSSAASPFGRFRKPFITIPRHIHAHPAFKHRTIECRNALPTRYGGLGLSVSLAEGRRRAAPTTHAASGGQPSSARSEHTGLNGPLLRGYSVAFRAPLHRAPRLLQDRMRSSSLTRTPRNFPESYNPKPSTGSRPERLRSRFLLPTFSFLRVTSRSLLRNFACRPFEVPNLFLQRRACGPATSQPAGNRYAWRTAALHSAPVAGKTVRSSQPLPFP